MKFGDKVWTFLRKSIILNPDAEVAELADALDSGSSARKGVGVQIPPSAPSILPSSQSAKPWTSSHF
jgi:hypothetical protein